LGNIPNCINYLGVGPIFPTGSKSDASEPMGSYTLKKIINKKITFFITKKYI